MTNAGNVQHGLISPAESENSEGVPTLTSAQILNAQHLPWLQKCPVLSAWAEFAAALPGLQPNPDLAIVTGRVRAVIDEENISYTQFRLLHPDRRDWSSTDHHVRFIVAVISDSLLERHWDKLEWELHPARIVRAVYEVLVYMKAVQGVENVEDVE